MLMCVCLLGYYIRGSPDEARASIPPKCSSILYKVYEKQLQRNFFFNCFQIL